MPQILLPQRFLAQPQHPVQPDYTGLAKGAQLLFNPALGPVDLATGRVWTPGGNASVSTEQKGRVFSFDGTDDYYAYTGYPEITGNVGTFFVWMPRVGAPDDFGHVYFGSSTPVVCGHQIDASGKIFIGTGSGASSGNLSSWFSSANRSLVLVSNGTAAGTKAFVDGVDTGFTWSSPPTAWGAGNKNFNFGRYVGSTTIDFAGSMLTLGLTSRVWGAAEAKAFHENPYRIFKAPARRLWTVPAAGTDYTLTADSFDLDVIGSDVSLEYNRALSADSVSLSFDVADATLKRGYALTADQLSIDFSGADTTLKYDRVLQADPASLSVTGTDASLEYNRALQADPATLSFGVADATLTYTQPGNYTLSAEPVTLDVAVTDAALKYDRKLTAEPAELAFNGTDASLRYARAVIAEAAQITFTVANATLTRTGGPEPITSIIERTATFRRSKPVTVRFN